MSSARTANLLGALVTALNDELQASTVEAAAHGAAFPAALASMLGEPGMSIEGLRRILGLSHSGTVRLLDCLESDGAVERKAGADARRAALAPALALLTTAEQGQLARLTEKLLAGLTRDRRHSDHICRLCDLAVCPDASCPVGCAAAESEV